MPAMMESPSGGAEGGGTFFSYQMRAGSTLKLEVEGHVITVTEKSLNPARRLSAAQQALCQPVDEDKPPSTNHIGSYFFTCSDGLKPVYVWARAENESAVPWWRGTLIADVKVCYCRRRLAPPLRIRSQPASLSVCALTCSLVERQTGTWRFKDHAICAAALAATALPVVGSASVYMDTGWPAEFLMGAMDPVSTANLTQPVAGPASSSKWPAGEAACPASSSMWPAGEAAFPMPRDAPTNGDGFRPLTRSMPNFMPPCAIGINLMLPLEVDQPYFESVVNDFDAAVDAGVGMRRVTTSAAERRAAQPSGRGAVAMLGGTPHPAASQEGAALCQRIDEQTGYFYATDHPAVVLRKYGTVGSGEVESPINVSFSFDDCQMDDPEDAALFPASFFRPYRPWGTRSDDEGAHGLSSDEGGDARDADAVYFDDEDGDGAALDGGEGDHDTELDEEEDDEEVGDEFQDDDDDEEQEEEQEQEDDDDAVHAGEDEDMEDDVEEPPCPQFNSGIAGAALVYLLAANGVTIPKRRIRSRTDIVGRPDRWQAHIRAI